MLRLLPALLLLASCVSQEQTLPEENSPAHLVRRGEEHFVAGRNDEALRAFQMAAIGSEEGALGRSPERSTLVSALAGAARVHAVRGDLDEAARWLEQAQRLAPEANAEARCSTLLAAGLIQQEGGDPVGARQTFEELFHLARTEDLPARAVQAAHMASVVSEGEDQVLWGQRALQAAGGRDSWRGPLLANLGWMYDRFDRTEEALECFAEVRQLAVTQGGSHGRLVADWQYARALRRVGQVDQARVLNLRTLARAQDRYVASRTPNDAEWLGRCYLERAEIERIDFDMAAVSPKAPVEELESLRETAVRDFTRARRLFLEAGAPENAPDLMEQVDAALEELNAAPVTGPR